MQLSFRHTRNRGAMPARMLRRHISTDAAITGWGERKRGQLEARPPDQPHRRAAAVALDASDVNSGPALTLTLRSKRSTNVVGGAFASGTSAFELVFDMFLES